MLKPLLYGLLAVVIYKAFQIYKSLDLDKKLFNHRPGECHAIKGVEHGSEDIAMVEELGLAFITSGVFWMSPRGENVRGKIFLYDYSASEHEVKELKIVGLPNMKDFYPHGITHFVEGNFVRLYVVVHSREWKHSIEVFDYHTGKDELTFVRSIKDEKFVRPNDIVLVAKDAFIVNNDGYTQTPITNMLEMISGLPGGSIAYYDGKESHWLLSSTVSPNGIALDKEKKHLFVSHINTRSIGVYSLSKDFKTITQRQMVKMNTMMDNFYMDQDGALWTGAHPNSVEAMNHVTKCEDLSLHSPSQVLRIKFAPDFNSWEITEVYLDDGRQTSASTVAIHYRNQLLIGTVCRQLVHCDIADKHVVMAY